MTRKTISIIDVDMLLSYTILQSYLEKIDGNER